MGVGNDPIKDDELFFADELTEEYGDHVSKPARKWKILIVDDEKDVHSTTKLVLDDVIFEDGSLEFLSAYTGDEALEIMREHSDIAVILLDVVMETTHAGLDVVRIIRQEMQNKMVRIILRTGQPGQAPERKVIIEYDINDYKHKGELTAQRLFTSVLAALRSYRDILVIDQNRKGLKYIIEASGSLFKQQSIGRLAQGVLTQVISLLGLHDSVYMDGSGMAVSSSESDAGNMRIIASTGRYSVCRDSVENCQEITEETRQKFDKICKIGHGKFIGEDYVGYLPTTQQGSHLLFVEGCGKERSEQDEDLLRIYSDNVGVAFDNIYLNQEVLDTQKEIVRVLGEVVEFRSKETAFHVIRVSEVTRILATALGLEQSYIDELYYASPMHDVGKIGIPDSILLKPGSLTPDEIKIMKTHTEIGYSILKSSKRQLLKTAAIIAYEHHEYWDGSGYPRGLKGEEIDIAGRITCITDVYDALCSKRVYKDAWDIEKATDFLKKNRGKMFDPALVDLFFENIDAILAVQKKYQD
jgi:response regulator RpfG family c-di-GMP phosphodiesterase